MKKDYVKLNFLKLNENNPRNIGEKKLETLKRSIQEFEKMLSIRPMLVDMKTGIVYGGNMRLRALKELGYEKIPKKWIQDISHLTEQEKRELIIKDNITYGEWDFDMLVSEYEIEELEEWGINISNMKEKDIFEDNDGIDIEKQYVVEVVLENEQKQKEIYEELTKKGYKCRIFTL